MRRNNHNNNNNNKKNAHLCNGSLSCDWTFLISSRLKMSSDSFDFNESKISHSLPIRSFEIATYFEVVFLENAQDVCHVCLIEAGEWSVSVAHCDTRGRSDTVGAIVID